MVGRAEHQVRERGASVLLHLGMVEVEPQCRDEQRDRTRRGDLLPPLLGGRVRAVDEREEREATCRPRHAGHHPTHAQAAAGCAASVRGYTRG